MQFRNEAKWKSAVMSSTGNDGVGVGEVHSTVLDDKERQDL